MTDATDTPGTWIRGAHLLVGDVILGLKHPYYKGSSRFPATVVRIESNRIQLLDHDEVLCISRTGKLFTLTLHHALEIGVLR